jgi:hypothetical protein
MELTMDLATAMFYGFLVGVLSAFAGYLKNLGFENFNLMKAWPALVIGLLSGAISYWQGVNLDDPQEASALAFLVILANNIIVALDKHKFFSKKGRVFHG